MEVQIDDRPWHKSSRSGNGGGDCVEVAECADAVYVRDTKDRRGPEAKFSRPAWATFLASVK